MGGTCLVEVIVPQNMISLCCASFERGGSPEIGYSMWQYELNEGMRETDMNAIVMDMVDKVLRELRRAPDSSIKVRFKGAEQTAPVVKDYAHRNVDRSENRDFYNDFRRQRRTESRFAYSDEDRIAGNAVPVDDATIQREYLDELRQLTRSDFDDVFIGTHGNDEGLLMFVFKVNDRKLYIKLSPPGGTLTDDQLHAFYTEWAPYYDKWIERRKKDPELSKYPYFDCPKESDFLAKNKNNRDWDVISYKKLTQKKNYEDEK